MVAADETGRSRYAEIADILRHAIDQGEYLPGDRLPGENAIMREYGVAQPTARRALAVLCHDGIAVTRKGVGTFVRARSSVRVLISGYAAAANPHRTDAHLGPWETACAAQGITGTAELVRTDRTEADDALAARLGVAAGAPLVRRQRRMWAGDRLVQLQTTWMPADLVAGTPLENDTKIVGGVYAAMTTAGFPPATTSVEVIARTPTSNERRALALPTPGTPVLEMWRATSDITGRILEILHAVVASDAASLLFDQLPLNPGARPSHQP